MTTSDHVDLFPRKPFDQVDNGDSTDRTVCDGNYLPPNLVFDFGKQRDTGPSKNAGQL